MTDITESENKLAFREGVEIFGALRKKYCNDSVSDLDVVLNSLCFALVRLFQCHSVDDPEGCGDLVRKIIVRNLKKEGGK